MLSTARRRVPRTLLLLAALALLPAAHAALPPATAEGQPLPSLAPMLEGVSPAQFALQFKRKKALMIEKPLHHIPGCFLHNHGLAKHSNFEEVVL